MRQEKKRDSAQQPTEEELRKTAVRIVERIWAAAKLEWLSAHPDEAGLSDEQLVRRINEERQRVWLENWNPFEHLRCDVHELKRRIDSFKPN